MSQSVRESERERTDRKRDRVRPPEKQADKYGIKYESFKECIVKELLIMYRIKYLFEGDNPHL